MKRSRHSQLGLVELRQPPLHLKLALSPHYLPLGAGTSSASSQTQTLHTVQRVPAAVLLVQCRYFQPQQHPTDLDTTQNTLNEARPPPASTLTPLAFALAALCRLTLDLADRRPTIRPSAA